MIITYLVPVLFTFYIQGVLKFKKNFLRQKVNILAPCAFDKEKETYPGQWNYVDTLKTNKHFYSCFTLYLTKYPYYFCDRLTQHDVYCRDLL